MKYRTCLLIAVACGVASATSGEARADDADADTTRAGAELHAMAGQAADARAAMGIVGLASGAALFPAGLVLITTRADDPVGKSLGVGMSATGGAALFLGLLSLRESGIEEERDTFDERRASGMTSAELMRLSLIEWQTAAEASRARRRISGAIETIFGVVSTAAGLTLLLANPGILGMDRNRQYNVGSLLVGPGVPFLSLGIRTLMIRSPQETLWETYSGAASAPAPARGAAAASVSIAPFGVANGGGVMVMGAL
jgi:hypothetical protein